MNPTIIIQVLICFLLTYGGMQVADGLLHFPRKKTKTAAKAMKEDEKNKTDFLTSISEPPARMISKLIEIPEFKAKIIENELRRAEIDMTPQVYAASAYVKAAYCFLLAIVVYLIGIPIAAAGIAGMSIMVYMKEVGRAKALIAKKDTEIMYVLPHFVSVVTEQMKYDSDILRIFERYMRDVPDTPLGVDLTECCANMRANGNYITALMRLDATLGIPRISPFLTALIEAVKGYNQTAYFQIVMGEMEVLEQENIERIIGKRPKKIKRATLAIMLAFILMLVAPVAMQLLNSLSNLI